MNYQETQHFKVEIYTIEKQGKVEYVAQIYDNAGEYLGSGMARESVKGAIQQAFATI